MKKQILVAAVSAASLMAFSSAFAQSAASSLTLYGQVNIGYGFYDSGADGSKNYTKPFGTTNGSRWGIRGEESLGNGMTGLFVIESGLITAALADATTGAAQGHQVVGDRHFYVGLSTPTAGKFLLGKTDTATSFIGNKTEGEFVNNPITQNAGLVPASLFWYSPSWDGLQLIANYANSKAYNGASSGKTDPTLGFGVIYAGKGWGVSLGYDTVNVSPTNTTNKQNYTVLDGYYDFSDLRLVATYNKYELKPNAGSKTSADNISLGLRKLAGANRFTVLVGVRDNVKVSGADNDAKATFFGAEYVYAISNRTRLGIAAMSVKDEKGGAGATIAAVKALGNPSPGTGDTANGFGIGVKHSF